MVVNLATRVDSTNGITFTPSIRSTSPVALKTERPESGSWCLRILSHAVPTPLVSLSRGCYSSTVRAWDAPNQSPPSSANNSARSPPMSHRHADCCLKQHANHAPPCTRTTPSAAPPQPPSHWCKPLPRAAALPNPPMNRDLSHLTQKNQTT